MMKCVRFNNMVKAIIHKFSHKRNIWHVYYIQSKLRYALTILRFDCSMCSNTKHVAQSHQRSLPCYSVIGLYVLEVCLSLSHSPDIYSRSQQLLSDWQLQQGAWACLAILTQSASILQYNLSHTSSWLDSCCLSPIYLASSYILHVIMCKCTLWLKKQKQSFNLYY